MKGARIAMLKTPPLKPGKRVVGLMLLWALLIPIGVALTACAGPEPTPTPTLPAPTPTPTVPAPTPARTVPVPIIVTFPDENLEAAIRDALGKPPGEEITPAELAELTELTASERGMADLSGIEHLSNLTLLLLSGNRITDVSPLASLSNLSVLTLPVNQISDISPLVENSGLGEGDALSLFGNPLDLSEGSEDLENIRKLEERGVSVSR